ncbi:MAG: S41 family peptidase [Vulcanimicrobiaceae bacterium]
MARPRPGTWLRVRRALVAAAILLALPAASAVPCAVAGSAEPSDADRISNFVRQRYAYLDVKQTDWNAVARYYRQRYAGANSPRARFGVLEAMLDELYDPHTHLDSNYADSWRLPAYVVWAEPRGGRIVVTGVHPGSGLQALLGAQILKIDGQPVDAAVAARRPRFLHEPDPAADQWALLSALAGHHDRAVTVSIQSTNGEREVTISHAGNRPASSQAVTGRHIAEGVGYINVASFGDANVVTVFDEALEQLKDTKALVVDLRDNSGGDTDVTLPIMGRFLTQRKQYAWMARRQGAGLGARWPEYIAPRGPWTYRGKVVILVDRWTESVAEGFAMGLEETRGAIVVGTPMAGLGAAVSKIHLPQNDVDVQISTEPVYALDGRPRSAFQPTVPVDLTQAHGTDPILAAGLAAAK